MRNFCFALICQGGEWGTTPVNINLQGYVFEISHVQTFFTVTGTVALRRWK